MLADEHIAVDGIIGAMETRDYINTMGKRLRIHREEMRLSQTDMVQRMREECAIDVRSAHISGIENGNKLPSAPVLAAIARVLNVSADYLLMLTNDPRPVDDVPTPDVGMSPEAEEVARITDGLPPFQRSALLAHARILETMERESERNVSAALAMFAEKIRANGLIIGENGMQTIRAALIDYTTSLLGADATSAIDAMATGNGTRGGRAKPTGK
jgi:transcriptional regulator with XRE-family HTH domain